MRFAQCCIINGLSLHCSRTDLKTPSDYRKWPPQWHRLAVNIMPSSTYTRPSYHRSRHIILHQCVQFYPNQTAHDWKMTSCRFSRWRRLDFRGPTTGSLKSPCTTSYRLSIETIALNYLVFEKKSRFWILATDRQTNKQTNRWTGQSHEAAVAVTSGGLRKSSAVAERLRDASCHWIFC